MKADRQFRQEWQVTFDERLDRLTERHEALTQTVELLVAENRQAAAENKQAGAENKQAAAENRQMAAENRQMAAENRLRDKRLGEIMEGIASLVHVAEIHEPRLDAHEDRLDNLNQKG